MVDTLDGIGNPGCEASDVSRLVHAERLDRLALIFYVLIFAVVPFAVVVFRTDMLAWHYYVAGAISLGGALAICAIDLQR